MNKKDQYMFLQKVGHLLEASLSLGEALNISVKSVRNKKLKKEILRIQKEVAEGKSLHEAMSLNGFWNKSTLTLIMVGEYSGTLHSNVLRASLNIKEQLEQNNRLLTALLYPAIISFLALGIIIFLLAYVYPKIIPMFLGMKMALPLSTRVMIQVSNTIQNYWLWISGAISTLLFLTWYAVIEWEEVRLHFENILEKIPLVGKIITYSQFSEISFLSGSLLAGGMNLPEAIKIAGDSVFFLSLRKRIEKLSLNLQAGTTFSEAISAGEYFPPIWSDLVTVGERTGSLSSSLLNISRIHRQEIDDLMAVVNKLIEPLMMIAVGSIVGFIALSIITPMYSLTQQVHG